jgi:tripartite-type tricarboxylate transporter receptor subunit TctC
MKTLPVLLCAALLAMFAGVSAAQNYPNRPIRLIVPFSAGGSTDVTARIVGQKLGEALGHTVVVDNRPGAAATIGYDLVAKASPDGYTLIMTDSTFSIVAALYPKLPYDPLKDFAPIIHVISVPAALLTHPSVPAKTVQELVALARAKPGGMNFGSGGVGSYLHMAGELFRITANVDIVHIPYKGAGPALSDLLGGQLQLLFPTLPSALPHIKGGRVRALAVTSTKRAAAIPDVPTMEQAGVPFVTVAWFGMHAPAKTPQPIVTRLYTETRKLLDSPDVKERFAGQSAEVIGSSPPEFGKYVANDISQWRQVVKTGDIKAE